MAKKSNIQKEVEAKCIAIVDQERVNWEEAVSFITPKVAFRMRELIRICRKNYWGVFDEPIDKNTTREKIWIGLIQSIVETWVKNTDIDAKDINFRAVTPEGTTITELTRLIVKAYLDKMYFGEILDADARTCLIDGTVVWKTWEDKSTGKPKLNRRTVDLLNFYIDPTEESIQSAYRVTERGLIVASDLTRMNGWLNTTDSKGNTLPGSQILNRADGSRRSNFGTRMTGDYRDVWECWGKMPRWCITKDKNADDANDEVEGHIVVSGLEAPEPTLHLVEYNTHKDSLGNIVKPYEEWRAAKITGRWYGLGVAERLLAMQEYLNTTANIRINRHHVSQLGLFKIKKGKGITPQMLSRLAANGAIQVQDQEDIEPLVFPQDDGTSYKDEEVIKYWSQQITGAMPISNGDILPASTTATTSSLASNSAKSAYIVFKEGLGMFLERWLDRGALNIIAKTSNRGDILRLIKDDDKWEDLIERVSLNMVIEHLEKSDVVPSQDELALEIDRVKRTLMTKDSLFIENVQDIIASGLETKVHITNEDLDTAVTIQNLFQLMQIPPEQRDGDMIKTIYDLMGLQMPRKTNEEKMKEMMMAQQAQGGQQQQAQGPQTMQDIQQMANMPSQRPR